MLTLEEIRAKYPQYNDKSDRELLGALHKKFYSNIPAEEFISKFMPATQQPQEMQQPAQEFAQNSGIDWRGIGNDVLSGGVGAVEGLVNAITGIPQLYQQAKGLGDMAPSRALQNALFGLAKGGHGLLNTPSNIANYAASRNIISPETAGYIPRQSDEGFEDAEWLLGEAQPGDALVQGVSEFLPSLVAGGPVRAAAAHAIGQDKNPIAAAGTLGLAKALGNTASGVNNLRRGRVAKDVIAGERAAKNAASKSYEGIFDEAAAKGLGENLKSPKIDIAAIKSGAPGEKYMKYVRKIEQEPTLRNLHKAGSDLRKFIRANENKAGDQALRDSLNAAMKAEGKIRNKIYKALGEGEGSLAERLMKTDQKYKETVVPYAKNKAIQDYKRGEIAGADLVKSLAGNKKFKNQLGAEHPEVQLSHALHGFGKLDPAFDTFSALLSKTGKVIKNKFKGKE